MHIRPHILKYDEISRALVFLSQEVSSLASAFFLLRKIERYYRSGGLLNNTPLFWITVTDALGEKCLLSLCKLFDHKDETTALRSVLSSIKDNLRQFKSDTGVSGISLTAESIAEDIAAVDEVNTGLLKDWRGNRVAHRNTQLLMGRKTLEPITDASLFKLIVFAGRLINRYAFMLGGTGCSFEQDILNREFDGLKGALELLTSGVSAERSSPHLT